LRKDSINYYRKDPPLRHGTHRDEFDWTERLPENWGNRYGESSPVSAFFIQGDAIPKFGRQRTGGCNPPLESGVTKRKRTGAVTPFVNSYVPIIKKPFFLSSTSFKIPFYRS